MAYTLMRPVASGLGELPIPYPVRRGESVFKWISVLSKWGDASKAALGPPRSGYKWKYDKDANTWYQEKDSGGGFFGGLLKVVTAPVRAVASVGSKVVTDVVVPVIKKAPQIAAGFAAGGPVGAGAAAVASFIPKNKQPALIPSSTGTQGIANSSLPQVGVVGDGNWQYMNAGRPVSSGMPSWVPFVVIGALLLTEKRR